MANGEISGSVAAIGGKALGAAIPGISGGAGGLGSSDSLSSNTGNTSTGGLKFGSGGTNDTMTSVAMYVAVAFVAMFAIKTLKG